MEDFTELADRVVALRPGWHAEDLSGFRYLPGGYSNRNYQFRHREQPYVLRVPQRTRPFIDRELEHAFYRSSRGGRVPEIEAFDPATGTMISRWQSGPLLAEVEVDPAELVPYVRSLHRDLGPCPRRYDPVSLARRQLSVGKPRRSIVELAHRIDWEPADTRPCHNDLNPWNIIAAEAGHWVTLDWEWLGTNDPLFDLVSLHQGLALDDGILVELAQDLLAQPAPDCLQRTRDCLTVFWLREYAWAHAELVAGNERDEIVEQARVSEQKLEGLGVAEPV